MKEWMLIDIVQSMIRLMESKLIDDLYSNVACYGSDVYAPLSSSGMLIFTFNEHSLQNIKIESLGSVRGVLKWEDGVLVFCADSLFYRSNVSCNKSHTLYDRNIA